MGVVDTDLQELAGSFILVLMDDFLKADVEPTMAFIRMVDEVVFGVVDILRFGPVDTSDTGEFSVGGLSQLVVSRNMVEDTVELALAVVFSVGVIETDGTEKLTSCCFVPVTGLFSLSWLKS